MEIYLKFAEDKAIMEKRQGQQEESPCEKEPNPKAAQPFVRLSAFNAEPASPGSSLRISRAAHCRYPPGTCPASRRF